MITNNGKTIIAKYLLNQVPEFVSHIAVGVGDNAISSTAPASAAYSSSAKSLDFEAFRIPVIAKGLIKEDDIEKIVLKAELPTEQRYRITELGLYSAEYDNVAGRYGSKTFVTFSNSEPWTYVQYGSASAVPYLNKSLQIDNSNNITSGGIVANTTKCFFANSDDPVFDYIDRKNVQEPPRYMNRSLAVSGGFSGLDSSFNPSASGYYIENSSVLLDLGNNLPEDEIKIAFSLVGKLLTTTDLPDTGVRLRIELINNVAGTPKAYSNILVSSSSMLDGANQKRYNVVTKSLSDFVVSTDFSWSNINLVRIYAEVIDAVPNDYFIFFDGLRFENISSTNPLYTLVGAEYIKTSDAQPVIKQENSTSYIEYRFSLGVS